MIHAHAISSVLGKRQMVAIKFALTHARSFLTSVLVGFLLSLYFSGAIGKDFCRAPTVGTSRMLSMVFVLFLFLSLFCSVFVVILFSSLFCFCRYFRRYFVFVVIFVVILFLSLFCFGCAFSLLLLLLWAVMLLLPLPWTVLLLLPRSVLLIL
jgi:hypothetical protein